jgi:hypothetical protein
MDAKYVNKFIKRLRNLFGPRAVIANHSIRASFIGDQKKKNSLYYFLKKAGKPLYFQTATWDRIAKKGKKATQKQRRTALIKTIKWAISLGAQAVELPDGHNLKLTQIHSLTALLQKN